MLIAEPPLCIFVVKLCLVTYTETR
jgi:hypothetical protein